jgi:hypothetical protein
MPIIRPREELCGRLSRIGLPEYQHNRRFLRQLIERSTGEPPKEQMSADELAEVVLMLHISGLLVMADP